MSKWGRFKASVPIAEFFATKASVAPLLHERWIISISIIIYGIAAAGFALLVWFYSLPLAPVQEIIISGTLLPEAEGWKCDSVGTFLSNDNFETITGYELQSSSVVDTRMNRFDMQGTRIRQTPIGMYMGLASLDPLLQGIQCEDCCSVPIHCLPAGAPVASMNLVYMSSFDACVAEMNSTSYLPSKEFTSRWYRHLFSNYSLPNFNTLSNTNLLDVVLFPQARPLKTLTVPGLAISVPASNVIMVTQPYSCYVGQSVASFSLMTASQYSECSLQVPAHLEKVMQERIAAPVSRQGFATSICRSFLQLPPYSCSRSLPKRREILEVISLSMGNAQLAYSLAVAFIATCLYSFAFRPDQVTWKENTSMSS
jgi:hypothetical protein